jgi:iron complex outermembrane receptor protein
LGFERIIVVKNKNHLNYYSLDTNTLKILPTDSIIEDLSFSPVDLQSRSLKGGIQTDFSLAGSSPQGVLVLIDGLRINDPQTAHHNSDLPLTKEDVERIEVMPAVGSSIYGPDAIGGAINICLKKPQPKLMVLELSAGSHQTESGIFSISDKLDNLGIRFSLERQQSQGFREDTDYKTFTTNLNSSLEIPDGEFSVFAGYNEKEFGAFDFYTPGLGYPSKEWTKTYLLATKLDLEKGGLLIKPSFLWRRHYDKFMLDKTQIRTSYLNHHRTDMYTPNIYFQKQTESFGTVGAGIEYGQEKVNSTNLGKHNRTHQSLFLDQTCDMTSKVSGSLSFRFDDFDSLRGVYTGSANLRYSFSKNSSFITGTNRSLRIPSFTELYYNDPTTVGDPDLKAESAITYQAGYDYQQQGLSLGQGIFLRQEKQVLDWVKHAPSDAKWKIENITKADVFGTESYLHLRINANLKIDINYTYINKYAHAQGLIYKYGPNYIKHQANTFFTINLPFGDQFIGLNYKKKPNRRGWLLLDTTTTCNLNKKLKLFLKTTNLLNVEYQEIEGIPQPGRWIEAGFRVDW